MDYQSNKFLDIL